MTEAEQSLARFGPDATLCSVADWLTAHVANDAYDRNPGARGVRRTKFEPLADGIVAWP